MLDACLDKIKRNAVLHAVIFCSISVFVFHTMEKYLFKDLLVTFIGEDAPVASCPHRWGKTDNIFNEQ